MFSGLLMWATVCRALCLNVLFFFFPLSHLHLSRRLQKKEDRFHHTNNTQTGPQTFQCYECSEATWYPFLWSLRQRENHTKTRHGARGKTRALLWGGRRAEVGKTDTVRAINSSLFTLKWRLWWLCLSSWITRPFGWMADLEHLSLVSWLMQPEISLWLHRLGLYIHLNAWNWLRPNSNYWVRWNCKMQRDAWRLQRSVIVCVSGPEDETKECWLD